LIAKAERLFLYGVGSSGLAVQELQNKLLRFGKIALLYTDTHFQVMSAAVTGKNDVVIAVTLSGETPDILETLTVAKKNKSKIIVITNHILSAAAQMANHVLLTAGRETLIDGGSLIAKMSQLYIIDVLCTGYALQNKDESLKMKHNTAEAVVRKNSGVK
jgi:transcription regulator